MTPRAAATSRQANGASTTAAMNQRRKFSVTGSKESRSARPVTQFPAQNRLARASRQKASVRLCAPNIAYAVRSAHEAGQEGGNDRESHEDCEADAVGCHERQH